MKKLNVILDDATIINIPFMIKLLRRYYIISISIPVLIFCFAIYFYLSQNDIYMISIGFKNVSNEADSPNSAIATLLGERTSQLSSAEIIDMGRSIDFYQEIASRLYKHVQFPLMNFNDVNSKKRLKQKEIFGGCKDNKKCTHNILRNKVKDFYSIREVGEAGKNYMVDVMTLDAKTSEVILNEVSAAIQENRVETIKHFLSEQRKISQKLIEKKREELEKQQLADIQEKVKFLRNQLMDIDRRVSIYNNTYHSQKLRLTHAEAQLKKTQDTLSRKIDKNEYNRYKKQQNLRDKIQKLRKNLQTLEMASREKTRDDMLIMSQIKKELHEAQVELKRIGVLKRSLSNVSNFLASKDRSADFDEFNYNVIKDEFSKISKEYKSMMNNREKIAEELALYTKQLERLQPSLDYLRLLESKTIQLKLVESTVVSDLVFDKHHFPMARFKRVSKLKVTLFSFVLAGFLILIIILGRYLLDNRIYDEYEMKRNFADLEIIGHTPDYS